MAPTDELPQRQAEVVPTEGTGNRAKTYPNPRLLSLRNLAFESSQLIAAREIDSGIQKRWDLPVSNAVTWRKTENSPYYVSPRSWIPNSTEEKLTGVVLSFGGEPLT